MQMNKNNKTRFYLGVVILAAIIIIVLVVTMKDGLQSNLACENLGENFSVIHQESNNDPKNFFSVQIYTSSDDLDNVEPFKAVVVDEDACIIDQLSPPNNSEGIFATGFQFLEVRDINADGLIDIVYLGQAMGSANNDEFIIYSQNKDNKFDLTFYKDDSRNEIELTDLDGDGVEEIVQRYGIVGHNPHVKWSQIYKWNLDEDLYEQRNDLFPQRYEEHLQEYADFLEIYLLTDYDEQRSAAECLTELALENLNGGNISGDSCLEN